MRERDIRTAEHFGLLNRCEEFEKALLGIDGVAQDNFSGGVDISLDGWFDNIRQVIIVPKYDIPCSIEDGYYERRRDMLHAIIETAKNFGLTRTEDRIEDYGAHYYIVFRADTSWKLCSQA